MINKSPADTALSRAMIEWSLAKSSPLRETATSWIYRVEWADGTPAALKLFKPDADEERRGAALLEWYGGKGAARVFGRNEDAVLMEWLRGRPLSDLVRIEDDEGAAEIVAETVAALTAERDDPPPGTLIPMRKRFAALLDARQDAWPPPGRDLFARAVGIAMSLLERPAAELPLHGDLHHDNILDASRGWVAIDPKGVLGDPVYELAPSFINPFDMGALCADPARIARLADQYAARLGFARKRVLGFAAAHAALSACWCIEDRQPITPHLAILPPLLAAYSTA